MSRQSPAPPPASIPSATGAFETFLSAFFRPQNIRVMLLVGAGIVFASSLMLVTKSWGDWPAWFQYLTVVGYTGGIYFSSVVCRRHLQLPATAKVLAALTLMLLPILFHALAWVAPGTAWQSLLMAALAVPSLALLIVVAPRILDDWMGQRQMTFHVCFAGLAIAGCLPKLHQPLAAIIATALFWAMFTAGSLKVNRLAFWMSETKRRVRGFAFVPIAILGTMFFTLVATKTLDAIPGGSLAIGIVMTAGTFLWTSREIAAAIRQRTGDLVRPLPLEILVPLGIGLVLTTAGVALSMIGFSFVGPTTYAVIPTAILASVILATVAWDMQDRVLTVAAVICAVIAYQCSPVLFADLVHAMRDTAAGAIHRDRVPLSMYGLTYVPLMVGLIAAAWKLNTTSRKRLAAPVQACVCCLATLLIAMSCFDILSAFLVCSVMAMLAIVYGRLFQTRHAGQVALALATVALATIIPAGRQLHCWAIADNWIAVLLTIHAFGLLCFHRKTDCAIRYAALIGIAGLAAYWISDAMGTIEQWPSLASLVQAVALLIGGLLYAAIHQQRRIADGVWIFGGLILTRLTLASDWSSDGILMYAALGLMGMHLTAWAIDRQLSAQPSPAATAIRTLSSSLDDVASVLLMVMMVGLALPLLAVVHFQSFAGGDDYFGGQHRASILAVFAASIVGLVRATNQEQREVKRLAKISIATLSPLLVTGVLWCTGISMSWNASVFVWAAVTALLQWRNWLGERVQFAAVWPVVITLLCIIDFGWAMRLAAAMVLIDPLVNGTLRQRTAAVLFAMLQIMMAAAALAGCHAWTEVTAPMLALALAMTGITAAIVNEILIKRNLVTGIENSLLAIADGFPIAAAAVAAVALLHPSTIGPATPVALLLAAGQCSYLTWIRRRPEYLIPAVLTLNLTLMSVWLSAGWTAAELYTLPIAISILAVTSWLGDRMPAKLADVARYAAVILMIASPLPQTIGGSWLHAAIVLAISVGLILASIGLRIRALMIAGSIGLIIDLIVMVVRTSMDHTTLMWLWGMAIGIGVLGLAAYCERHRERLLSRVRMLSAELATWN